MADVKHESWLRMQDKLAAIRPPFPPFNVGDAVEIQVRGARANHGGCVSRVRSRRCPPPHTTPPQYANEISEAAPLPIRGTVIAKRNQGVDSKFTILNVSAPQRRGRRQRPDAARRCA